jgi:hypothetical protein
VEKREDQLYNAPEQQKQGRFQKVKRTRIFHNTRLNNTGPRNGKWDLEEVHGTNRKVATFVVFEDQLVGKMRAVSHCVDMNPWKLKPKSDPILFGEFIL